MVKSLSETLRPTLWRTCRALANQQRLRLLQYVMESKDPTVSEIADGLGMPISVASQYLRSLNARGFLKATRYGPHVVYEATADKSLPEAAVLLKALKASLKESSLARKRAFHCLTAFTHPRRVRIVRVLHQESLTRKELEVRSGMSRWALYRHLRKLRCRGFVRLEQGRYCCAHPGDALSRALLRLAMQD